MSLRERHEQQKSEQASPRERIQELNRQSRTELENKPHLKDIYKPHSLHEAYILLSTILQPLFWNI